MKKIKLALITVLSFMLSQAIGQNFKQQFAELLQNKDTIGQIQVLGKWEKAVENDPELYIAYFNYYVNRSISSMLSLGSDPSKQNGKDSSFQKDVMIYNNPQYDPELVNKGFSYIDKGIKRNPDRLDMMFGKIYILGQLEEYDKFTDEIIAVINHSAQNGNSWLWGDNIPLKDAKKYMLSSIQASVNQMYNTQREGLRENIKRISGTVLKYYPDHMESLTNLAVIHIYNLEYDKALEILLKTDQTNPRNYVILNNIAYVYKMKGDFKNSIKYYELVVEYGNDKVKDQAMKELEVLRSK